MSAEIHKTFLIKDSIKDSIIVNRFVEIAKNIYLTSTLDTYLHVGLARREGISLIISSIELDSRIINMLKNLGIDLLFIKKNEMHKVSGLNNISNKDHRKILLVL